MGMHARIPVQPNLSWMLPLSSASARRQKGRQRHFAGHAAEEQVARTYQNMGGTIRQMNCRTPEGEIDLITEIGGVLVFVEVKQRKKQGFFDPIVTDRQWRRLENAAIHYIKEVQEETGIHPICRFDVALTGHDGSIQIIENARSFDA